MAPPDGRRHGECSRLLRTAWLWWDGAQVPLPCGRGSRARAGERGPVPAVGLRELGGAARPREIQIQDNQPPRQQSKM